ncbi:hypothetical protein GIB67_005562 [Kingdonia uniflora]|uniref:Uncharacterized protein n=1 Tax=Kingdonia uniflora TaxID=39325 RepID=A0A7J7NI72_9MAGN|nr:hypothetical protein GIB67_005562 [Kingdonia uniflora]
MEGAVLRPWDVLGLIFYGLSLQEILTVIPSVCKSWGKAVAEHGLKDIDIIEWGKSRTTDHVDRMLQMLITRSSNSLRKLSVSGISDDLIFSFIANHASNLETLWLPIGKMSSSIVEQVAWKLSTVINLDLSYCVNIKAPALEAIGKHCKSLKELHRLTYPPHNMKNEKCENEIHAIVTTMPKLKHLELSYMVLSSECANQILSGCPELQCFDVRRCFKVTLEVDIVNGKKFPGLTIFVPPPIDHMRRRRRSLLLW